MYVYTLVYMMENVNISCGIKLAQIWKNVQQSFMGGGWGVGGLELKEKQCNFSPPLPVSFLDLSLVCIILFFSFFLSFLGVQCEECTRATATSSCSKCETVYCRACFERVCLLFLSSSEHTSSTPQLSLRKSLNEKALSGISLGRSLRKQRMCQKLLLNSFLLDGIIAGSDPQG